MSDTTATTKGKKKRKNHFVPRMLLKNFTDEDGKLYFFDKRFKQKQVRETTPKDLYWERDLYVLRGADGNMDDSAEDLFAEREREVAPVFNKIIAAVRKREEPVLSMHEGNILDRYIYFQWERVLDVHKHLLDHTLKGDPEIQNLPPEELSEFRKRINVESLTLNVTETGDRILSYMRYLRSKGLAFVLIPSDRKKKSFVIGSNPIVRVFPDHSEGEPKPFIALWLPLAYDVAVAYGGGPGGLTEFSRDSELRRFNEEVFKQSQGIAGRSRSLIASLAGLRHIT